MSAHVKVIAAEVAKRIYLPPSWPNVNVIAAAIDLVTFHANVSAEEAAELLIRCAAERTIGSHYTPPSEWELREIFRENKVDRFWFEDARWKTKFAYAQFHERLDRAQEVA